MGESENIELIVDPSLSGMRLDAYLREQTPFSRSRIASLMEEGALLVNGEVERKAARKTEGGMRCSITSTIYPASGEKCGRESSIGWTRTPPA